LAPLQRDFALLVSKIFTRELVSEDKRWLINRQNRERDLASPLKRLANERTKGIYPQVSTTLNFDLQHFHLRSIFTDLDLKHFQFLHALQFLSCT
jgi:hypothetical protein